eukprot:11686288-Heterocapsa_arctica.AAC.1
MSRNTCLGTTSDTFSIRWLGKMLSKTKRLKALQQVRKADRLSDLNKWDMKSKLAVTTSTVLGVDVRPRQSIAPRPRESSGEDNTANLS